MQIGIDSRSMMLGPGLSPRAPESSRPMPTPRKAAPVSQPVEPAVYMVPRTWLTAPTVLVVAPWVILSLDSVKDYYRPRCENPRLIYHRRKDF